MLAFAISLVVLPILSCLVIGANANVACFNMGYGPQGTCNSDPNSTALLETYLIHDHLDPACEGGGTFTATAVFLGASGVTSTVTAINTPVVNIGQTGIVPFSFAQPLSAIGAGSVTLIISATNSILGGGFAQTVSYLQAHTPTVVTAQSTVTMTSTSTVSSVSTLTISETSTSTSITRPINGPTITQSRIKTTTAAVPTTRITSWLTPKILTTTSTVFSVSVSTLPCIPLPTMAGSLFAVPWCDAVVSSTFTQTPTTTSSPTQIVVTKTTLKTTSFTTSTLITSLATVYLKIESTTTVTPPTITSRIYSVTDRPTTTVTRTMTTIKTVKPSGAGASTCTIPGTQPTSVATGRVRGYPMVISSGIPGWKLYKAGAPSGCFQDDPANRVLSASNQQSGMTAEICLAFAGSNNNWAGVENGDTCWYGNSTRPGMAVASPQSLCNVPCSGNSTEICGGSSSLTLYMAN